MFNDRAPIIETIKQLEMPLQDLATLAGVVAARVTDYKAGRKLPRETELRIERAARQVEKVWQGYQIKIPPVPVEAFQRALATLEMQERLEGADDLFVKRAAIEAEIARRQAAELVAAAQPIKSPASA